MDLRVVRRNRAGRRECSERARLDCEVERSEKLGCQKVSVETRIELRLGFLEYLLLLMDFQPCLLQLSVVHSGQFDRSIQRKDILGLRLY